MSKRKKRATVIKSSNGSVASTTNGDSSRRGKAFLSHLHENNWCFLDLAVQQAMNSSVKDDSMVETRRSSPRKLQSTSQWTENAKEVACALSVYFFGIDTSKNTICLPPELPQDEKRKETIKAAFGFINQWRNQLKAGTYVEYFDGLRIQKATVDQNLKGVDSKGFQVPILSETGSLEDYSLKQEDIAIKLAARQNWLIFSPHFPISKDIGIAPEGSFRILAEASNGSFDMQEAEDEEETNSTNSKDRTAEEDSTMNHSRKKARLEPSACNGNSSPIHEIKSIPKATSSSRVGKKRGRGSDPSGEDTCPDQSTMVEIEQTPKRNARGQKTTEANANTHSEQPNEKKQAPKTKKTKSYSKGPTQSRSNDFTWICALCHEAECQLFTASSSAGNNNSPKVEENDLDFLVICEGPCNRAFHILCATPGRTLPFSATEEWKCKDCNASQHACCLCGEYGEDNKDVWCCNRKDCGLFFHERCLAMGDFFPEVQIRHVAMDSTNSNSQEVEKNDDEEEEDDSGEEELGGKSTTTVKFACPAHHCWTCDDGNAFGPKSGPLFRCLYCPNAYHSTCIPPNAKFHELALLCHNHSKTHKLPDLDVTNSIQAELEKDAQVKIDKINRKKEKEEQRGNNEKLLLLRHQQRRGVETTPFFKSLNLRELQKIESPFLLPVDFKNEVYAKPPDYNHVQSLQYDKTVRPKRREPSGESCQCHLPVKGKYTSCGQTCLNRITYQECVGNPNTSVGEKNKYWNCEIGIDCGNRMIGRKQSAHVKVKRQVGKGFGLTVVDGVKRGCLVQEYVGDVINEDTKKQRLAHWAKDNPNDPNFYMMQLEPGWYIDARERGNLSRFINHSCEPNCMLVPKNVAGYMRMAIIAMKDIEPGGFLSYDYQFETNQAERFACRCGAKSCRGSLMSNFGANKGNNEEKKNKKQLLIEAKARVERDQKFLEDYKSSKMKRLNQIGLLVPSADHRDGSETVISGPQWKHRHCNHIFLWRNAVACGDWNQRLERRILQRQGLWPKPKILKISPPRNTLARIKEWSEKVKSA